MSRKIKFMIFRSTIIICVWITMIQTSGCSQKEKGCNSFYKTYSSSKNRDTLSLLKILNDVISQDSLCINALLTRGDIFFDIDSFHLAKDDYFKVLSLDSQNVYSMYQLGELFNLREEYDSAIAFFQKAINLKSNGNFIYDRTNERLDSKAKYDIEGAELLFAQGLSFYYKRELKPALNNFNFTIQHKYKLDKSYLYRAAILIELGGQQANACLDLNEAKKYGNKDAESYIEKYCKKTFEK